MLALNLRLAASVGVVVLLGAGCSGSTKRIPVAQGDGGGDHVGGNADGSHDVAVGGGDSGGDDSGDPGGGGDSGGPGNGGEGGEGGGAVDAAGPGPSDDASGADLGPVPNGPPSPSVNFIVAWGFDTKATGPGGASYMGLGNFDGDGRTDVVAVDTLGMAGVFLNQGARVFTGEIGQQWTGGSPGRQAMAVADLNGDGKSDLVVAAREGLGVMLNRGDGTLADPVPVSVGFAGRPRAGDLNGDGKVDLVASLGMGFVVLINKGDGSFAAPVLTASGMYTGDMAVADVNGDGNLDVITASALSNCASVFSGRGDGTLIEGPCYQTGVVSSLVTVGDLSGDGKPDLVVGAGTFTVLENDGRGAFALVGTYPAQDSSALAIGDLNGDGKPDVATGGKSTVSVFMNGGNAGLVRQKRRYLANGEPATLAITDVTGDGKADVVASVRDRITVLENLGDGTLLAAIAHDGDNIGEGAVIADVNTDGKPDLTIMGGPILTLLNQGPGSFSAPLFSVGGASWYSTQVGDLNRDGKFDFVAVDRRANVGVFLGSGNGAYESGGPYPAGMSPHSVAIGDLDGDGDADLATMYLGEQLPLPITSGVNVLMNEGSGTFAPPVAARTGFKGGVVAIADFNGDGAGDIAVAEKGSVNTLINKGDGTFPSMMTSSLLLGTPKVVAVGDLNRDGRPDIVLGGTSLDILTSQGDGTFFFSDYHLESSPVSVAIGDVNRDGWPDVVIGGVVVFLNKGNGTFKKAFSHFAGQSVAIGDLNGDGWGDLAGSGADGVSVILNSGR